MQKKKSNQNNQRSLNAPFKDLSYHLGSTQEENVGPLTTLGNGQCLEG